VRFISASIVSILASLGLGQDRPQATQHARLEDQRQQQ
jgi:hypothetical protein